MKYDLIDYETHEVLKTVKGRAEVDAYMNSLAEQDAFVWRAGYVFYCYKERVKMWIRQHDKKRLKP